MKSIFNKIEAHIDNIDKMKTDIQNDITVIFDNLNAKNFLASPGATVDILIFAITEKMIKSYIKPIVKESRRYVESILKSEGKTAENLN